MAVLFISTYVVLKVLYGRALANFLEPREGRLMFGSLKAYLSLRELSSRKAQREAEKALARYRELKQKAVESAKRVFTGEAIEKAKQRGLLPKDLTLEEYAEIVKKVLGCAGKTGQNGTPAEA